MVIVVPMVMVVPIVMVGPIVMVVLMVMVCWMKAEGRRASDDKTSAFISAVVNPPAPHEPELFMIKQVPIHKRRSQPTSST